LGKNGAEGKKIGAWGVKEESLALKKNKTKAIKGGKFGRKRVYVAIWGHGLAKKVDKEGERGGQEIQSKGVMGKGGVRPASGGNTAIHREHCRRGEDGSPVGLGKTCPKCGKGGPQESARQKEGSSRRGGKGKRVNFRSIRSFGLERGGRFRGRI